LAQLGGIKGQWITGLDRLFLKESRLAEQTVHPLMHLESQLRHLLVRGCPQGMKPGLARCACIHTIQHHGMNANVHLRVTVEVFIPDERVNYFYPKSHKKLSKRWQNVGVK
jgi:hypothetical protein